VCGVYIKLRLAPLRWSRVMKIISTVSPAAVNHPARTCVLCANFLCGTEHPLLLINVAALLLAFISDIKVEVFRD
jgi:hypothetical protein